MGQDTIRHIAVLLQLRDGLFDAVNRVRIENAAQLVHRLLSVGIAAADKAHDDFCHIGKALVPEKQREVIVILRLAFLSGRTISENA